MKKNHKIRCIRRKGNGFEFRISFEKKRENIYLKKESGAMYAFKDDKIVTELKCDKDGNMIEKIKFIGQEEFEKLAAQKKEKAAKECAEMEKNVKAARAKRIAKRKAAEK